MEQNSEGAILGFLLCIINLISEWINIFKDTRTHQNSSKIMMYERTALTFVICLNPNQLQFSPQIFKPFSFSYGYSTWTDRVSDLNNSNRIHTIYLKSTLYFFLKKCQSWHRPFSKKLNSTQSRKKNLTYSNPLFLFVFRLNENSPHC